MKKRIFLLPLFLLGTSASAVTAKDLYRIYCYTDPVISGEPLNIHFQYTCLSSAKVTEVSHLYLRLFAVNNDGSLTEWDAYTQETDPNFPSSFKKGSSYSFVYPLSTANWSRNKAMQIHHSMNFIYDRFTGGSLAMTQDCSSTLGLPYFTKENPLVARRDQDYSPGRTSYDLGANFAGRQSATTYQYHFRGIAGKQTQVMNAFRIKISRTCVESGAYSLPLIQDAHLSIYGHSKEFGSIADPDLSSSTVSVFPLEVFSYAGVTSFQLEDGFVLDRRTGEISKGNVDEKHARTSSISLPVGAKQGSAYYASTLSFYMDGDYVEIPLEDINPYEGVGGKYEVVLWEKEI